MNNGNDLIVLLVILAIIGAALMPRKWRGSGTAFGTARTANIVDLRRAGMLEGNGLSLGRAQNSSLISIDRYTHMSVFAPTGAGKGVSFIVPWLLTYRRGSCVVLDPKGENAALTATRRQAMGQKVVILDPFQVVTPTPSTFNLFDLVGEGPECADECKSMAEAMVARTGEEKDPHWNDQAGNVIAGFTAFIASTLKPEERNLGSLRELISQAELCGAAVSTMRDKGGVFARMAGVIAQLEDKEKAGVFSTVHRHTTFLDSDAILGSVSKSSFDARELLKGNMTIYLVLPPHQLDAQSRWLRLVIATLMRLIGREGMQNGKECLFILDEAGQLGHMAPIDQGLTLLRSYGLKMAFFFQSLGQLKSVFRDKESVLLDNTEQIYFGVNSYETAERVSKRLGMATIMTEDATAGVSQEGNQDLAGPQKRTRSEGRNWKEHGRELLKPDEVLNLNPDYLIAFLSGMRPIICRRIFWYRDKAFGGRPPRRRLPLVFWLLLAGGLGLLAWQVWMAMGW